MPFASIKKKIPCSKKNLIEMVLDIEKYPEFVPFCMDAKVYEKKEKDNLLLIVCPLICLHPFFARIRKSDVRD